MKRTFKNILPIVLLLATVQLFAQDEKAKPVKERYENWKERTISKSYPASGNKLNIENTFGNVTITTWNNNEIKVNIHIEASSTDKDLAETMFNNIDVIDSKEGNQIKFKTILDKNEKNNKGSQNSSSTMHIDYTIQMPADNALNIENKFGDIKLPDYNGPVSLNNKFGKVITGNLSHPEKIIISFAKEVELKGINNGDLDFNYSPITIGELKGKCTVKMSFCSYSKINLNSGLTSLELNDSYSSVHLDPGSGLSANYTINTSYGSFIDKTDIDFKRTDTPGKYGADMKKSLEGKSGSGAAKIDIKSSFGIIMIGKGTEDDMKEKKKVRS